MGESAVEKPTFENKMGESVPSAASLQVSVSFGRFESDSLSWEKWSSFSPNKYLEEVGKCSTPGSVAQKKAYFEAHYKKIAARKTEQLEQEKLMESVPSSSEEPDCKDAVKHTAEANGESGSPPGSGKSGEDVEPDVTGMDISNSVIIEEEKERDSIGVDSEGLLVEEAQDELNGTLQNPELNDVQTGKEEVISNQAAVEVSGGEGAVLIQEANSEKKSLEVVEQPLEVDHKAKKNPLQKSKSPKLYSGNVTQKMSPTRKKQMLAGTKKVVSPATRSSPVNKLSQLSTPKLSKSTIMSTSISTTKKVNGSSLSMAKNSPGENRRAMATSLHMSLNVDPLSSGPSLTSTRKSSIMESMGDKDIVRRAFKTFQNSINGLKAPNDGLSSWSQQGTEKNVSTKTPQKVNEGLRKSEEKTIQRCRLGNASTSATSWSIKGSRADKGGVTVVSSSTSVRNDARVEKWKEKPGEKSFVREAERPRYISKTKEEVVQVKNTGQRLKSKASLAPAFNRGQGSTTTPSEKEKSKIHLRPTSKR